MHDKNLRDTLFARPSDARTGSLRKTFHVWLIAGVVAIGVAGVAVPETVGIAAGQGISGRMAELVPYWEN